MINDVQVLINPNISFSIDCAYGDTDPETIAKHWMKMIEEGVGIGIQDGSEEGFIMVFNPDQVVGVAVHS